MLRTGVDVRVHPLVELASVLELERNSLDPDYFHDRPILERARPSTRAP
jgi:hypothetical protein